MAGQKLGCLGQLLRPFLSPQPPPVAPADTTAEFPYIAVGRLLTTAERAFYGALLAAIKGQGVFAAPKVRLADVINVATGTPKAQGPLNRIQSKHIDFVICRADTTQPILAIELDDASHASKKRRQRDEFLDAALGAAGLPILHIATAPTYDPTQLAERIRAALASSDAS